MRRALDKLCLFGAAIAIGLSFVADAVVREIKRC